MDRRAFLRRSAPILAVASVAPLALMAAKPKTRTDANGRLIVDGEVIALTHASVANGLTIHAIGPVSITNCHLDGAALHIAAPSPVLPLHSFGLAD